MAIRVLQNLASLFALTFLGSTLASAVPVLDQINPTGTSGSGTQFTIERAQVFTVGLDGVLTQVDLRLFESGAAPLLGDVTYSVYQMNGDLPQDTPIATGVVSGALVKVEPDWVAMDLAAFGITVSAGDRLAFGVRTVSVEDRLWVSSMSGDPYASGHAVIRDPDLVSFATSDWFVNPVGYDLAFRTYVDPELATVPEPGTALLMLLGLTGVACTRRSRTGP